MTAPRTRRTTRADAAPKAEDAILAMVRDRGGKTLGVVVPTAAKPGKRPSKYRNVFTVYEGATYASKAEAAYAAILDREKAVGRIRGWTRQVPFYLGCHENKYQVDFVVWLLDGGSYAVDVKGVRTAKFNRDCRLWRRYAPCELHIVTREKVVEIIVPECMEKDGGESDAN